MSIKTTGPDWITGGPCLQWVNSKCSVEEFFHQIEETSAMAVTRSTNQDCLFQWRRRASYLTCYKYLLERSWSFGYYCTDLPEHYGIQQPRGPGTFFGIYHEIMSLKKPSRRVWDASGPFCVSIPCYIGPVVQQYTLPGEDGPSCLGKNLFSKVLRLLLKTVLHSYVVHKSLKDWLFPWDEFLKQEHLVKEYLLVVG